MKWPRWMRRRKPFPISYAVPPPVDPCARVLSGAVFVDLSIDLTGRVVDGCQFDGCIVTFWDTRPASITRSRFTDCLLIGDGWGEFMFG